MPVETGVKVKVAERGPTVPLSLVCGRLLWRRDIEGPRRITRLAAITAGVVCLEGGERCEKDARDGQVLQV